MSDNRIQPDDPRLTAYALGELDPTEQQEIERLLTDCPEAQIAVKEVRDVAGMLTNEFRQEPTPTLTAAQRAAILNADAVPADANGRNGAVREQQISALATRDRPAAEFRSQHTLRVRRFASLAAVAALLVVVALLVSLPRANNPSLVALNEQRSHFAWSDFSRPESFDADMPDSGQFRGDPGGTGRELYFKAAGPEPSTGDLAKQNRRYSEYGGFSPATHADRNQAPGVAGMLPTDRMFRNGGLDTAGAEAVFNAPSGGVSKLGQGSGGGSVAGRRSGDTSLGSMPLPALAGGSENSGEFGRAAAGTFKPGEHRFEASKPVLKGQAADYKSVRSNRGIVPAERQPAGSQLTAARPGGAAADKGNHSGKDSGGLSSDEPTELARRKAASAVRLEDQAPVRFEPEFAAKVQTYNKLLKEERFDEAIVAARQAQSLMPADPVPEAMLLKAKVAKQTAWNKALREKNPDAFSNVLSDVESAPVDFTAEIEYPNAANWKRLFELRDRYRHGGMGRDFAVVEELRQKAEILDDLGTEAYTPIVENSFLSAYEDPLSTFGVDVDTASYANVRRFLTRHQLPPRDAVRIEELVNYFSYDYPQPAAEQPFSVNVDAANCPWNPGNKLVRIGVQGKEIPSDKRPPGNLVFLVDVSGSMQADNKLPLVKMGLNLLTQQLTETDRVAIVTYSDKAVQRLESTNGANKQAILGVIDSLQAAGSTNGGEGIQLAYRTAIDHFIEGGVNRVILCTDGDFNVGVTSDDELVHLIQERARTKVFFSVFGFGMGNLKDGKLEKLADTGNGHYAYIDGQNEARRMFVDELVGTLVTIAKDVKLQVEFNPNQVNAYRLLGYENRVMPTADFNNDKKDAGDVGAGHAVTALYEVLPAGEAPKPQLGDALRYRKAVVPQEGPLARELLTVKLRYKQPEADASTLVEYPIANTANLAAIADGRGATTSYSFQLLRLDAAPAADSLRAWFGEHQQESPVIEADGANRRLLVRGSVEQISQGQKILEQLGETGSSVSPDFNWAAAVAAFGLILRNSQFRGQANLDMVLELATAAKGEDPTGRRQEFIDLVKTAKEIAGRRADAGFVEVLSRMPREQLEGLATVDGKYKNLLRIVEASGDVSTYGPAHDFGRWEGTSYANQNNLPRGYWVYVYPNWYIWGDVGQ